MDSNFYID